MPVARAGQQDVECLDLRVTVEHNQFRHHPCGDGEPAGIRLPLPDCGAAPRLQSTDCMTHQLETAEESASILASAASRTAYSASSMAEYATSMVNSA
jgi:hypothetical protein